MTYPLPLDGKGVLIPRGNGQAKSFSSLVEKFGGIPIEIPLIAFQPVNETKQLLTIFQQLHTYNWIIFTSKVTVETFFSFNPTPLPKIAVIGEKTKEWVEKKGYDVAFLPTGYVAETFVKDFLPRASKGEKVLIPKGSLARDYIANSLSDSGIYVDEVVIYETYFPKDSKVQLKKAIMEKKLDILAFTSPSTVNHFIECIEEYHLWEQIENCLVTCIGPVTYERAIALGLSVHVVPEQYTVEAMIKSINNFITK
ncbi:uroporphyrinogen-III synthase [Cytobacillus spongiae]|uniref:uroporphyrinogen-III synthase n=1 Tax=Cytobacillus spongiae TaxID=2901381 RepID=UPI001F3E7605|nr:uroporphyrinogen-III synthase [Cytobacillus spongiae]UII55067.1 uroporphyrinogen-III synthase [Cytobacillus spongiae]